MSDYCEMYENLIGLGYDPAYVGEKQDDHSNEPIDIDEFDDDYCDAMESAESTPYASIIMKNFCILVAMLVCS